MTRERMKLEVLTALREVAPELDVAGLDPTRSFRDQGEVDSVDFMNFVLELERRFGLTLPEVDYPKLSSLCGCLAVLEQRLGSGR